MSYLPSLGPAVAPSPPAFPGGDRDVTRSCVQGGDEKLKNRLSQKHIECLDRQTVPARRRENACVVRDNAREGIAVPQPV